MVVPPLSLATALVTFPLITPTSIPPTATSKILIVKQGKSRPRDCRSDTAGRRGWEVRNEITGVSGVFY